MASQGPPLAERVDIHKSCKSLETLLNVLNDYCEAAGAVVLLQKKLAKALRETANLKVTGEIASNAMIASATIFDALSDVDSKFAKIADKEYDAISAEVKKWFKKLAKEEKAHDERLSSANAKIKQAGQIYEKKSKKNPRDSADEHARYINLISSLGPEISQEKYNHTLQVTQRHTATTYSVAACVSRVADAEWLRTCEGVRRFSPTIGPLGEWRSLCEGGWTGPLPQPLDDPDPEPQQTYPEQEEITMRNINPSDTPLPSYEREQTPSASPISSPKPARANSAQQSSPPSSFDPPRPFVDPNSGSVRSLSAFPPPPTHFPIPSRPPQSQQASSSSSASNSNLNFPSIAQSEPALLEPERQVEEPSSIPSSPNRTDADNEPHPAPASVQQENTDIKRPIPVRSQTVDSYQQNLDRIASPLASGSITSRTYARGDYLVDDHDFAAIAKAQSDISDTTRFNNGVQRSDTGGSTGSVVAAIRNRYSFTSGASSPAPKDIPRLPMSVNDLATLYQPVDAPPLSPRARASSPPVLSSRPPLSASSPDRYAIAREAETAFGDRNSAGGSNPAVSSPSTSKSYTTMNAEAEAARRRNQQQEQRIDEVAELDFLEKEKALREKEREIGMRAKELELERANLRNAQTQRDAWDSGAGSPKPQLRPRERKTSFRNPSPLPRPQSQLETRASPGNIGNNRAHSYSTTHLVPPSAPSQQSSSPRSSTPSADGSRNNEHAPYCGCESCSITHYKSPSNRSPSPNDLRPPEKPFSLRPEKPKGWIRRLSMPVAVGNAFSLDKKNTAKMYSLDASKRNPNGSATTLRNVEEDGRMGPGRRSYDASGVSNRSMTSLVGAGGRR
ncbi:hypothetical protein DFH07DRAFT_820739 [Mycena maculata]|uniref:Uncharacterized protein n=1 Tax=Mycena maculata TaxID=230809 RepID=A0AAD7J4B6_9AGAR|nr:hypothetical protein DFH07DRAFT_820739 [Mycena maculata]